MKLKPENEMQKIKYEPASMEIIRIDDADVITSSGMGDTGNKPGINLPIDLFD